MDQNTANLAGLAERAKTLEVTCGILAGQLARLGQEIATAQAAMAQPVAPPDPYQTSLVTSLTGQ